MAIYRTVPRLRFGLRTLLVLVALSALLSNTLLKAHRRADAAKKLSEQQAFVLYNDNPEAMYCRLAGYESPWCVRTLGQWSYDVFYHPISVSQWNATDETVDLVVRLPTITKLSLGDGEGIADDSSGVTDAGIAGVVLLRELKELTLECANSVTDAGLSSLGKLQTLDELNLALPASATPSSLKAIGPLKNLSRLTIVFRNHEGQAGLNQLASLTGLHELTLVAAGPIALHELRALRDLPCLESLSIQRSPELTDADLQPVSSLPRLTQLNLSECPNLNFADVPSMPAVTRLFVACDGVTDDDLWILGSWPRLNSVSMIFAASNAGPPTEKATASSDAPAFPQLWELSISGPQFDWKNVRQMHRLVSLELSCEKIIRTCPVGDFDFPRLKLLRISSCNAPDLSPASEMPAIDSLEFQNCNNTIELSPFAQSGSLTLLDASFNEATFTGLDGLVSLQDLSIKGLSDIDVAQLVAFTRLRKLALGDSHLLSDAGVAHLSRLKSLESMELWDVPKVTDAGIAQLKQLNNLRDLNISGTNESQFSNSDANDLKQSLPNCQVQLTASPFF